MKARWALIFFAAGLGTGWLIFGGGVRESAEAAGNKSAAAVVRKREARPVTTPHEAKFRSFAKELPKLSYQDKETFKKSLAPKDRAAAIEAMLAQAGPNGISSAARDMIYVILKAWAGEDFDGAWAWCRRLESDANRNYVTSDLLDQIADTDPDRALALHLEMTAGDPDFRSTVLLKILKQATSKDAASFLDLFGKLPLGQNSGASPMDFAEGFDFQQAADGFASFKKSHPGKSLPVFPLNFLSTWAERDAEAAFGWFLKEPCAFKNEGFANLLVGIEKQGVPGASAAWAADKLNDADIPREVIIRSLTGGDPFYMPANTIESIAQAMPDAASRDRFLGDVVTMSSSTSDPAIRYGSSLTQMSSPAARLETLRQLGENSRLHVEKIPDAQLQQWGLTRQQVEQLQAPSD